MSVEDSSFMAQGELIYKSAIGRDIICLFRSDPVPGLDLPPTPQEGYVGGRVNPS